MSGEVIHDCLRQSLKTPPSATTLRVNTIKYQLHDAQSYLSSYLSKQVSTRGKVVISESAQILKLADLMLNLLVHGDLACISNCICWTASYVGM